MEDIDIYGKDYDENDKKDDSDSGDEAKAGDVVERSDEDDGGAVQ